MKTSLSKHILALCLSCASLPLMAAEAYVALSGAGGSVSQFKSTGGAATRRFATPPGAVDMVLSKNGYQLFVGTTSVGLADVKPGSPSVVGVLDASTGALLKTYPMPSSVVAMVINAAGDHIFATGSATTTGAVVIMSLDLRTGKTLSVPVPSTSAFKLYPLAVSPDGKRVYVPENSGIAVFDASALNLVGNIKLGHVEIVDKPSITPDGTTLLAIGAFTSSVLAVDLASGTLKKSIPIPIPGAPFGSALSPDGKTFYASAGTLSAIDVPSLTVKGSVALGQTNPYRLGISPDGSTLFATDLTFATTAVVDAASLTVLHTITSIAPPFAVVVPKSGNPLILDENANSMALVDTSAMSLVSKFPVGDAPTSVVLASGQLFVAEAANVALETTPLTPLPAYPIQVSFISTDTVATAGGDVFANSGSAVRVIDPLLDHVTASFAIKVVGDGVGSALSLAGSGDGQSLLASYVVQGFGTGDTDGGIIVVNAATLAQTPISSFPFVPQTIASNRSGTAAFGIGFLNFAQVGRWDLVNKVFSASATLPGNPAYSGLVPGGDGSLLYLADANGKVDVVNASTLQLVASVPVGVHPSAISLSADASLALVSDSATTAVTVLSLSPLAVIGTIGVGATSSGSVFLN